MIREISDIKLGTHGISNTDIRERLGYMMVDNKHLDLSKAENWLDRIVCEGITKTPRRQGVDEKQQISRLKECFGNDLDKPKSKTFISGGELFYEDKIVGMNPPDADSVAIDNGWTLVFTMKGGQKVDGGAQDKAFNDVIRFIDQAPKHAVSNNIMLIVYVSGPFWTTERRKYRGWEKELHTNQLSLIDCLEFRANGRKCVILTDDRLPQNNSSLYKLFVEGKYDE